MTTISLETTTLAAGIGLHCFDACTGTAINNGLHCSLVNVSSGVLIARSFSTLSGIHHFPGARAESLQPAPIEALIEDTGGNFTALRVPWPPPTVATASGARLCRVLLLSAPERPAPTGAASLYASLVDQHDVPAAWVRVVIDSSNGERTVGMSNATGQLAVHLPFPRPERSLSGPSSPSEPPSGARQPFALAALTLFHSSAVAAEADRTAQYLPRRVRAPRSADWLRQPAVVAQDTAGSPGPLSVVRFEVGRPSVLRTAGLGPGRSELRLLPV